MEEEVLNDKEISDYLDKYDISYWSTLVPKLTKIGIRTLEKKDPNIYTIDEIDNYLKEIDPNPQEEEKDPYEGMWPEYNEEEKNLNSQNEDISNSQKIYDTENSQIPNPMQNSYENPNQNSYQNPMQNSYQDPMQNSYQNPMRTSYDQINTNYESPMKKYEIPKMNNYDNKMNNYNNIMKNYQNPIRNNFDYKPLNNYSFNQNFLYSSRNNCSSLEIRASSPRYTYECKPNTFRSARNNLPVLNYDYNNFKPNNRFNYDDCCNKSSQFRNSNYSYRPINTSWC